MERPTFRVEGRGPMELWLGGFVSQKTAHWHLFKHVIRICDLPPEGLRSGKDPENWSEIIPSPPLARDLEARRMAAAKRLSKIPGCELRRSKTAGNTVCSLCSDSEALEAVNTVFSDLLDAYVGAAGASMDWAKLHFSSNHPFLLAFRQNDRPEVRLKFVDRLRVMGVGIFRGENGEIQLLTCYRKERSNTVATMRLDLCRERSGHRSQGTLVELERA